MSDTVTGIMKIFSKIKTCSVHKSQMQSFISAQTHWLILEPEYKKGMSKTSNY